MKKTWWKESVVYQIYPRSFMDSNGDGIGDLNGITSKFDYLEKLGIDVIWLSPVYQSPNADNGYDISDYQAIMKEFGTMEEFDRMLEEAHKHNIKIMMDLVVNHSSDEHNWFVESRKSKNNPYRDYYIWRDAKADGSEPNNWGACFGGSAWKYDATTNQYYLHLFAEKQPDLNWENEKVRNSVFNMMNWWCNKGIDGFRMDVISMISKVPEMPDGEVMGLYGNGAPYYMNGPRVHEFLQEMNEKVLSKHDLITVGETAGVTIEEAKKYAGEDTNELNMVFQFEHVGEGSGKPGKYGKWDQPKMPLSEWKAILSKWQTSLEGKAWNSLYLSNHDQPRCLSKFGNDSKEYRIVSAKMLATCLHMMQGTPYVYQGEELGMTNAGFESIEDYRDIESLNAYDELTRLRGVDTDEVIGYLKNVSRDNARTPIQWDDSENAGFTTGIPWISVNSNYKEINAAKQVNDPESVFSYYKKLIKLRHENDIVVYGRYELLEAESEELFAYTRTLGDEKLLVLCNFTDRDIELSEGILNLSKEENLSEVFISNYKDNDCSVLKPYEARVLKNFRY